MFKKNNYLKKEFRKVESGMATLICTLILLIGASSIVIYCVRTQIFLMKIASNEINQRRGFTNAESGLEAFFYQLKNSSSRGKLFLKYICIKNGSCKNVKLDNLSTDRYNIFLNSKLLTEQDIEVEIISKGKNNSGAFVSSHKRRIQMPNTNFRKPNAALITKGDFKTSLDATYQIKGKTNDVYTIRSGGVINFQNPSLILKNISPQTKGIKNEENKKKAIKNRSIENVTLLPPDSNNYIGSKTIFKQMFGIPNQNELTTDLFQDERSKISPKRLIDMRLNQGSLAYCEKRLNELKLSGGTVWIIGNCSISNKYLSKNPITMKNELIIGSTLSPIKLVIEGGVIKSSAQYRLNLFGIVYLVPLNGINDHTSLKDPLKIDHININGNLLVDYEYVEAGKNMIVTYDYRVIESLFNLSNYGYEIIKGSWSDFE